MFKFAASTILAATAASASLQREDVYSEQFVAVSVEESYEVDIDVLPDAMIAVAMEQGEGKSHIFRKQNLNSLFIPIGRDNTDWSWAHEHNQAEEDIYIATEDVNTTEIGLRHARLELIEVQNKTIAAEIEHRRQCQLHREEEMNLYYQCTQNDINNYALHHFGGEMRSYPRWVTEYNVCIDHLQSAKWLWLDYYHDDGAVELRACDPTSHESTVYVNVPVEVSRGYVGIIGVDTIFSNTSSMSSETVDINVTVNETSAYSSTSAFEEGG